MGKGETELAQGDPEELLVRTSAMKFLNLGVWGDDCSAICQDSPKKQCAASYQDVASTNTESMKPGVHPPKLSKTLNPQHQSS